MSHERWLRIAVFCCPEYPECLLRKGATLDDLIRIHYKNILTKYNPYSIPFV